MTDAEEGQAALANSTQVFTRPAFSRLRAAIRWRLLHFGIGVGHQVALAGYVRKMSRERNDAPAKSPGF